MNKINNVLICGLGAIGGYYASKIFVHSDLSLKILADKNRIKKYKNTPRIINGEICDFDYIPPDNKDFLADLVIISTKSKGFNEAVINIKNFVKEDTIILSFLNGITGEQTIENLYGKDKVLYSYLIGHTFFRKGNNIEHDGNAKIVFGSKAKNNHNVAIIKDFFDRMGFFYEIPDDILYYQWAKFCFNCCVNQLSAITGFTFKEIRESKKCMRFIDNIISEISSVAKKEGINNTDKFHENVLNFLDLMIPDGKTSMLQDIEAKREPELDIFGKTIINLGEKHNINTPYNKILCELIECISEKF